MLQNECLIRNLKERNIKPRIQSHEKQAVHECFNITKNPNIQFLRNFFIFTYNQLYHIVKSYIDYYNNYRPHQGLKAIPNAPQEPISKTGVIKQKSLLFGLHNHYYCEAA